jgi:DNA polymerase-3 subunit alpha
MSEAAFVHLHVHSHYSLLSALGNTGVLASHAAAQNDSALALTDSGNMHGSAEFFADCKKKGVRPILGLQAYLAPRSRFDKEPVDAKSAELVLLAKDMTGYRNLLELTTEAYLHGLYHQPRIDWDLLSKHAEGLICLSGGANGEVIQSIIGGDTIEKTKKILARYQKLFGEDFYIELQRHPTERGFIDSEKQLLQLAKELKIELVATNNAHYPKVEDAEAHDILMCIKNNAQKNDPGRPTMIGDNYALRPANEMRELFKDLPEACDNTLKIAEKCNVEIPFGDYLLPPFPVPEGATVESYLEQVCEEGLTKRYGFDPKKPKDEKEKLIAERLYYELKIINDMGFPAYFLIVWDFVKWSKDNDILVGPGRGSAAGSLVSYALTITNIDPIRYDLLFERFLNPERVSMPDIDIDFPDDRREEVLNYVREKYGADRVAQICTFGTMAARAAVKDVGRVLGLGFTDMNQFAKLIPEKPGISLNEAFETAADLRKALEENPRFAEIWELAKKLEGGVRHVSVHACAVVISPDALPNHTAMQRAPKDDNTIITQFSAKPIEKLGLLKMDFLGLKNLTILVKTLELIKAVHNVDIDLDSIELEDKKSFKLLSAGQTTGVFQLESPGMKRYLKQLKPTNLEDIIAMVSLYRPGPMEWIPDYIDGKHQKKKVKYAHESLTVVLDKTFGIAIYQEQILQIAQVFAGFTLGQADILRRAIGKKIASELASQREKFIEGAQEKGHSEKLAIKIFDEVIEPFAGYGFNKSHAAGYAMIAYQTAFLKANYPTEFMTALLSSDRDNTDRVIIDIEECRELGIEVMPPSVNESNANFTVVGNKQIRFGLGAIKGVGDSVVDSIIKTRETGGAFTSFADFAARCPSKTINKKSLEALAKSGALSELIEPNMVIENVKQITDFSKAAEKSEADAEQDSLFGEEVGFNDHELVLPETEPAKKNLRLSWERETLGLFVSDHPLRSAKAYFKKHATLVSDISRKKGKKIKVGGLFMGMRKIITKTKKQMAIIFLEDPVGKLEIMVFPKSYEKLADQLVEQDDMVYWVRGKADVRDGQPQVIADEIRLQTLGELEATISGGEVPAVTKPKVDATATPLRLKLKEDCTGIELQKLHQILAKNPGARPIEIHALNQVFQPPMGVTMSDATMNQLKEFAVVE